MEHQVRVHELMPRPKHQTDPEVLLKLKEAQVCVSERERMTLPAAICLAFPVLICKCPLGWLNGVETVAPQLNRRTFLGNLIWPQEDDTYPIYQDSYVTVRAAPTNHVGLTVRSVQHGFWVSAMGLYSRVGHHN